MNSFRNPKPIQSGKAKVSLSTVPTINRGSQHNNTIAIPTCSGIMFQEGSFSDTTSPGFYSRIFLVKKKTGRFRLIIDLSSLNKMMKVDHFQMETAASIRRAIPPGAWAVSIDLMDAYLHPASRKYLRFFLEGTVYQFRALPFGISTAPFVFTNLMEIVAGYI